jgi:hypothetical protein
MARGRPAARPTRRTHRQEQRHTEEPDGSKVTTANSPDATISASATLHLRENLRRQQHVMAQATSRRAQDGASKRHTHPDAGRVAASVSGRTLP